jgi:protein-S-isoprenylcysteine O-methyltransferase Ste14
MENTDKKESVFEVDQYKDKVHWVLAYSYSVYFTLFLVGVFLDLIFNLKFLNFSPVTSIGVIFIVLATGLIFWAQRTSRNLKKETLTKETFCKGPYRFTRSPTHWGLFLLILGFGIIINAIFVVISAIISLILTKLIYLKKEETILEKKNCAP